MKHQILKALIATILLACGLGKASAAMDPSARAERSSVSETTLGDPPCVIACTFLE